MPRHQQVTTCRRDGGPVSKLCSCEHCTLGVCSVCGAYEGSLTTDCPGSQVDYDRQQEVYQTNLDYTDVRGWHQGDPEMHLTPRFTSTLSPMEPLVADPRVAVAPTINWTAVDQLAHLQHELMLKSLAWVLADRVADDHSVVLTHLEDALGEQLHLIRAAGVEDPPSAQVCDLLAKLEHEKIAFHLASQHTEKCDDEFRQAARKLVAALEGTPPIIKALPKEMPRP